VTAHPAALVLADHQPVYVTASTQPGSTVRCCCGKWAEPWCEFAAHQADVLVAAGLLAPAGRAPAWMPGADFGSCYCKSRGAHFRGPGCEMVMEL
jgi:hypothetical protein